MGLVLLAIAGGVIIIGLSSYAGYLIMRIKTQKRIIKIQEEVAIKRRNEKIFDSVRVLCHVGITQQCDLSEITIRVVSMLEHLQGEDSVDLEQNYPATLELYHIVKDMARADDRQQLEKQERMKQNLARQKAESRLSATIIDELTLLLESIKLPEGTGSSSNEVIGDIPIKML